MHETVTLQNIPTPTYDFSTSEQTLPQSMGVTAMLNRDWSAREAYLEEASAWALEQEDAIRREMREIANDEMRDTETMWDQQMVEDLIEDEIAINPIRLAPPANVSDEEAANLIEYAEPRRQ